MCVTLLGGMDRLRPEYEEVAAADGHTLKCVARNSGDLESRLGNPDLLIVFTNKISHEAKRKAAQYARQRRIPIRLAHSCGISTLRNCLRFL